MGMPNAAKNEESVDKYMLLHEPDAHSVTELLINYNATFAIARDTDTPFYSSSVDSNLESSIE